MQCWPVTVLDSWKNRFGQVSVYVGDDRRFVLLGLDPAVPQTNVESLMPDLVSVYLSAAIRVERHRQHFAELGVLTSAIGDVLRRDWKRLTIVGHHTLELPTDYAHPEYPHELEYHRWPDAEQLCGKLAEAHRELDKAVAAWSQIPLPVRAMLQPPAFDPAPTIWHDRHDAQAH